MHATFNFIVCITFVFRDKHWDLGIGVRQAAEGGAVYGTSYTGERGPITASDLTRTRTSHRPCTELGGSSTPIEEKRVECLVWIVMPRSGV